MVEIIITEEFKECYQLLPKSIQKKAEKQERLFRRNIFHPSLHAEKLEPRGKETWSFRIDKEYRILFKFITRDKILFLVCGHHNWIYKYQF